MLESVKPVPEQQAWRRPTIETSPEEPRNRNGHNRGQTESADSRWTASSLSTPASIANTTPMGMIKASPWPDVALHPPIRSPVLQEGEDWYAIDVAQAEVSGPSDADLYHVPMVPKGPGLRDSAGDEAPAPADRQRSSATASASRRQSGCCNPCGCFSGSCGALCHGLSLIVAERPLRKHREWAGTLVPDGRPDGVLGPDSPGTPNKGGLRRKLTFQAISGNSGAGEGGEEKMVTAGRKKRRLAYALRRKDSRSYTRLWDRLTDEIFIFGESTFDMCTPARMDYHVPLFTVAFIVLNLITFAYMAGEYGSYVASHPSLASISSSILHSSVTDALPPAARGAAPRAALPPRLAGPVPVMPCPPDVFGSGPQALIRWVSHWDECFRFRPDFLVLWGARGVRHMSSPKQWWRWLASLVIADSAPHMAVTLGLFAVLGLHLEPRYGTVRIAVLSLIAGLGGNFFDGATLDVCRVAIAGPAICFGLLGLFWADMLLNFESIRYPFLRTLAALACLGAFIAAAVLTGYPFGFAPLGGFLATLFPAALFLPHIKSEKYEWFIPYVAFLSTLAFLGAVPAFVYLARLRHAPC